MSDLENLLLKNLNSILEVPKPSPDQTGSTDLPETGSQVNENLDPDSFNPCDFLPEEGQNFAAKWSHLEMNKHL